MKRFKVLVTTTSFQDTPGSHHELLNQMNWDLEFMRGPLNESQLKDVIHKFDGIICGDDDYNSKILKKGFEHNLKALSKYGVGLDKIDLSAAKKYGIKVSNCPGVNHVSVAEHALALLFTFEKNIHHQYNSVQNKSWNRMIGNEISGKSIGIIGMGSVGKELAKKSVGLGLNVMAYDINQNIAFEKKYPQVKFCKNIDELFSISDIISLHIPHNKSTEKLINKDVLFNKVKQKPIIINTSRGRLVDIEALIYSIKNGLISGYLTDVLSEEPISDDEKLLGLNNVIITPHVGSRTYQSVEKQAIMAINNLENLLN